MSFPTDDPAYLEAADAYARETIQYAKDNPVYGIGQPVAVYDNDNIYHQIGEGVIVSMFWSEYFYQYICDVRGTDCVYPCVLAGCLEPIRRSSGSWVERVVRNG